jgi:hypothetical protein
MWFITLTYIVANIHLTQFVKHILFSQFLDGACDLYTCTLSIIIPTSFPEVNGLQNEAKKWKVMIQI